MEVGRWRLGFLHGDSHGESRQPRPGLPRGSVHMRVSPSRLVLESARQNGATSIKRCLSSLFPLLRYLLQVTQEGRVCSGSAVKVPTTSAGAGGIWSCRTRKQDTDRNECCSSACSLLFVHLETPNLSPSGKPSGNAVPDTPEASWPS